MPKLSQKIFLFIVAIFFTPTLFTQSNNTNVQEKITQEKPFKLGLENITEKLTKNIGSVALVTNQTGIDQNGKRNVDIFLDSNIKLKKIFTPEHGLDGKIPAEKTVPDTIDEKTKIPVLSLYPGDKTKPLSEENLSDVDTIVFDMQDAGMRHYTYITTLCQTIDAASQFNKKIIVLDRPNLLGPIMEGPLVEKEFKSTVSFVPIPLRHGMTIGELALYYNRYIIEKPAKLEIVCMQNYKRNILATTYKLLTPLSPNITSIPSCHGYSFLGLLGELNPINVGIGTDNAFQVILISDNIKFSMKKWEKLQKILKSYNIHSDFYRFFDDRKNNYYIGLKLKITNIITTKSFKLLIDILKFFQDNKNTKNNTLKPTFSNLFNKAIGTDKIRKYLDNKINLRLLKSSINKNLFDFYTNATKCFLYKPFAQVEYL